MKCSGRATPKKVTRSAVAVCAWTFFLLLALFWNALVDAIMKSQFLLSPHSVLYKIWTKNSVPIYLEIYLFNLTNAEEFERNKTAVPNFEEVGPFYFEESREKVSVSWDDSEETVSFNQTKTWRFLPERSRDLWTRVTNINPIASTIAYMSRLWTSQLHRQIANALLDAHEPLTVTASAQEWIFDGITDDFLRILEPLRSVAQIPIPYDRFGWFYQRNGSSSFDGVFTIKTGRSAIGDLGMMAAWNHENKTEHYVDSCALVRGSTGEIIPPLEPLRETLPVFASDICSYITLAYAGSEGFGGVSAYEYVGDERAFDNGSTYPENECFCVGESCPSGSRNVSSCRFGSPAFISFPHFYLADRYFGERITGMRPDESKHRFRLKVEPRTGVPLAVEAPFQINFFLDGYQWCDDFRGRPKIHVPMLWFKQTVRIPGKYLLALAAALFVQSYGGYFIGGCLLSVLVCCCCCRKWSSPRQRAEIRPGRRSVGVPLKCSSIVKTSKNLGGGGGS